MKHISDIASCECQSCLSSRVIERLTAEVIKLKIERDINLTEVRRLRAMLDEANSHTQENRRI